tara:strand:+ start:1107 stop:1346 length:240 start_codon:yes stop_codon:yes gene_type:complete
MKKFRQQVRIDPCVCNEKCGNYILSIKGKHVHMDNAPPDEFIDVCTLDLRSLCDLMFNISETLELQKVVNYLEKHEKTP